MRVTSLKSLIPKLAKPLAITPAAIYERQRALVRAGLLHARAGRGPGSGVPGDAKSVAILLISVLTAGSLSEVAVQTKTIANLKSTQGRCPMTGKKTFAAALTATLNSAELLSSAFSAHVTRSGKGAMASIVFLKDPTAITSPEPSFYEMYKRSDFGADRPTAHFTTETSVLLRETFSGVKLGTGK